MPSTIATSKLRLVGGMGGRLVAAHYLRKGRNRDSTNALHIFDSLRLALPKGLANEALGHR